MANPDELDDVAVEENLDSEPADTEQVSDDEELEAGADGEQALESTETGSDQAKPVEKETTEKSEVKKPSRKKRRSQERFTRLLRQNAEVRQLYEEERASREDLEERLRKLEEAKGHSEKKSLQQMQAQLRQDMEAAIEAGETGRQMELMEQLVDIKVELQQKQQAPPVTASKANQVRQAPNTQFVDEWKMRNPWYEDPEYSHYAVMAENMEQKLLKEGYKVFSQELFEELDDRLAKRVPEIKELRDFDEDEDDENNATMTPPPEKTSQKKATGASVVSGAPRQTVTKKRSSNGQFSNEDRASMSNAQKMGFPIDPDNPKHREAYKKWGKQTLDDDQFF